MAKAAKKPTGTEVSVPEQPPVTTTATPAPGPVAVAPAKPAESKADKMVRLGNKRVSNTLAKIRLIGNLAAYKPSDAQIDAIMAALGESCAFVEARLRGGRKESYTFTLNK